MEEKNISSQIFKFFLKKKNHKGINLKSKPVIAEDKQKLIVHTWSGFDIWNFLKVLPT